MRLFSHFITAVVFGIGSVLLSLPAKMAEDMVVSSVTEYATRSLGVRVPVMETIISSMWLAMPWLAVGAMLYLYHFFYSRTSKSATAGPVWESAPVKRPSIGEVLATILSIFCLVSFVVAVGVAEWRNRPLTSLSLRYSYLGNLSNSELRDRAFAVTKKITILSGQYKVRQAEINNQFDKIANVWKKQSSDYEVKLSEYNAAFEAYDKYQTSHFEPHIYSTYSFGISPFGNASAPCLSLEGCTTTAQPIQAPEVAPTRPTPPTPPSPQPVRPVIHVENSWATSLVEVQEEAAAVWEEICHRQNMYPTLFQIPPTYNYDGPKYQDLDEVATQIESLANSLHGN